MKTTKQSTFSATLRTTILLASLGGLLVVVGALIGGPQGALGFLVLALLINGFSYFFSDKLALASARAKPIDESEAPRLYQIVRELTTRAGLPMPRLYMIPSDQPNAFATGRNPKHSAVAVTRGITKLLSEDELRGVLGHELTHVRNRDILIQSVASAIGTAITYIAYMLLWFGDDDNSPLGGSCEYAEYSDPCLSTIGCDPDAGDLKCYEFLGADSGPEPLCGTPCVVPTDCIDATSACYQAYLGDGGLVGACTLNPCPNAYQSCPVGDGGVGTCIPFEGLDYYVCSQSGPVPLNSPCSQTIVDGGEYLCQANDLCIDNTQDGVTWCAASCGGSLSCPASTTCVPEYVFCLTPCNSPSNCTTPFGCLDLYDSSGNSVGNYCIASDAGVTGE